MGLWEPESALCDQGQYFLLKILILPLCHQRQKVHFQFPHISEETSSSSLSAQIFRDSYVNEVSKIKCKIYILVKLVQKNYFYFSERYLYHKEATMLLNS